jgi:hypothetical protein
MTEGVKQKFKISKRYNRSIKTSDGGVVSFATELETEVEVDSGEKLVAECDKLIEQVKWLTEADIDKAFGKV